MSTYSMAINLASPPAPDTGYLRFYPKADGWYYKGADGIEKPMTFTAEQVMDIVGALVQGSDSIEAVYDDAGDLLTIKVKEVVAELNSNISNSLAVTTQDFVRVSGTVATTVIMNSVNPVKKHVKIKNNSSAIVTIQSSVAIDDTNESTIQLRPKQPNKIGQSVDLNFEGGKWWVT